MVTVGSDNHEQRMYAESDSDIKALSPGHSIPPQHEYSLLVVTAPVFMRLDRSNSDADGLGCGASKVCVTSLASSIN